MILLNGKWKTGLDRNYTEESNVPGIIPAFLRFLGKDNSTGFFNLRNDSAASQLLINIIKYL